MCWYVETRRCENVMSQCVLLCCVRDWERQRLTYCSLCFALLSPPLPYPNLAYQLIPSTLIHYIVWIRLTNLINYATIIPYYIPLSFSISFLLFFSHSSHLSSPSFLLPFSLFFPSFIPPSLSSIPPTPLPPSLPPFRL